MSKEPYETPRKARDPNDLERHILDPNIAKSEAEWWAKSRIEELERERDLHKAKFDAINKDFDALKANNARLREALEQIANGPWPSDIEGPEDQCRFDRAITQQALAATPKQSLARLRNQVRYECAEVCDRFAEREMHPAECAAAIRAMKEPE